MARIGARELLDIVLDPDSFQSWDKPPAGPPAAFATPGYASELASAAAKTGLDEAIITGAGRIRGWTVAVILSEFDFLAGSMGVDASERLTAAVERATHLGLPLLASPTSGGTRMQEGTVAFMQMVKMTQAITAHKAKGLPYLVYLRHPTTGGVMASFGSLGHITVAEPKALLGFLGPRVYEALYQEKFPEGVQIAENLQERGIVDAVLPPSALPAAIDRALRVLLAPRVGLPEVDAPEHVPPSDAPAWDSITITRRIDRPGIRALLRHAATDVVALNGTGQGETDPGMLLVLARFGEVPCIVLGQCRHGQSVDQPMGPGALREARRGFRLARDLDLPLVTIIDTPGAALSAAAENGGIAGEIARCLADLTELHAPTVSVLLGQGTGGGALALVPADRVLAAQHAWLSPLPPEGASVIVHRDTTHAPQMAEAQHVRAADLVANGIVHRLIAEHDDAADEPVAFCERVGRAIQWELTDLLRLDPDERLAQRHRHFRVIGTPIDLLERPPES